MNLGEGAVPLKTLFFTTEINEDTEETWEMEEGLGPVKALKNLIYHSAATRRLHHRSTHSVCSRQAGFHRVQHVSSPKLVEPYDSGLKWISIPFCKAQSSDFEEILLPLGEVM
jgi:hypothetical protein